MSRLIIGDLPFLPSASTSSFACVVRASLCLGGVRPQFRCRDPAQAVALTFDDGYVDNLHAGLPRLAAADVLDLQDTHLGHGHPPQRCTQLPWIQYFTTPAHVSMMDRHYATARANTTAKPAASSLGAIPRSRSGMCRDQSTKASEIWHAKSQDRGREASHDDCVKGRDAICAPKMHSQARSAPTTRTEWCAR